MYQWLTTLVASRIELLIRQSEWIHMPRHAFSPSDAAARGPLVHPPRAVARAAANDDIERKPKLGEFPPNPLWVITIGMAAFFGMTALLMIFT
jgi:hypothetical protein